jgi:hypothetical protein
VAPVRCVNATRRLPRGRYVVGWFKRMDDRNQTIVDRLMNDPSAGLDSDRPGEGRRLGILILAVGSLFAVAGFVAVPFNRNHPAGVGTRFLNAAELAAIGMLVVWRLYIGSERD